MKFLALVEQDFYIIECLLNIMLNDLLILCLITTTAITAGGFASSLNNLLEKNGILSSEFIHIQYPGDKRVNDYFLLFTH